MRLLLIGHMGTDSITTKSVFRIVDVENEDILNRVIDVPYFNLISTMKKGVHVEGLGLENDRIIESNGSINRYTRLGASGEACECSKIVISDELCKDNETVGYRVFDVYGNMRNVKVDGAVAYAKKYGIANGKVVNRAGTEFISSLKGNYNKVIIETTAKKVNLDDMITAMDKEFRNVMTVQEFNRKLDELGIVSVAQNINEKISDKTGETMYIEPYTVSKYNVLYIPTGEYKPGKLIADDVDNLDTIYMCSGGAFCGYDKFAEDNGYLPKELNAISISIAKGIEQYPHFIGENRRTLSARRLVNNTEYVKGCGIRIKELEFNNDIRAVSQINSASAGILNKCIIPNSVRHSFNIGTKISSDCKWHMNSCEVENCFNRAFICGTPEFMLHNIIKSFNSIEMDSCDMSISIKKIDDSFTGKVTRSRINIKNSITTEDRAQINNSFLLEEGTDLEVTLNGHIVTNKSFRGKGCTERNRMGKQDTTEGEFKLKLNINSLVTLLGAIVDTIDIVTDNSVVLDNCNVGTVNDYATQGTVNYTGSTIGVLNIHNKDILQDVIVCTKIKEIKICNNMKIPNYALCGREASFKPILNYNEYKGSTVHISLDKNRITALLVGERVTDIVPGDDIGNSVVRSSILFPEGYVMKIALGKQVEDIDRAVFGSKISYTIYYEKGCMAADKLSKYANITVIECETYNEAENMARGLEVEISSQDKTKLSLFGKVLDGVLRQGEEYLYNSAAKLIAKANKRVAEDKYGIGVYIGNETTTKRLYKDLFAANIYALAKLLGYDTSVDDTNKIIRIQSECIPVGTYSGITPIRASNGIMPVYSRVHKEDGLVVRVTINEDLYRTHNKQMVGFYIVNVNILHSVNGEEICNIKKEIKVFDRKFIEAIQILLADYEHGYRYEYKKDEISIHKSAVKLDTIPYRIAVTDVYSDGDIIRFNRGSTITYDKLPLPKRIELGMRSYIDGNLFPIVAGYKGKGEYLMIDLIGMRALKVAAPRLLRSKIDRELRQGIVPTLHSLICSAYIEHSETTANNMLNFKILKVEDIAKDNNLVIDLLAGKVCVETMEDMNELLHTAGRAWYNNVITGGEYRRYNIETRLREYGKDVEEATKLLSDNEVALKFLRELGSSIDTEIIYVEGELAKKICKKAANEKNLGKYVNTTGFRVYPRILKSIEEIDYICNVSNSDVRYTIFGDEEYSRQDKPKVNVNERYVFGNFIYKLGREDGAITEAAGLIYGGAVYKLQWGLDTPCKMAIEVYKYLNKHIATVKSTGEIGGRAWKFLSEPMISNKVLYIDYASAGRGGDTREVREFVYELKRVRISIENEQKNKLINGLKLKKKVFDDTFIYKDIILCAVLNRITLEPEIIANWRVRDRHSMKDQSIRLFRCNSMLGAVSFLRANATALADMTINLYGICVENDKDYDANIYSVRYKEIVGEDSNFTAKIGEVIARIWDKTELFNGLKLLRIREALMRGYTIDMIDSNYKKDIPFVDTLVGQEYVKEKLEYSIEKEEKQEYVDDE